MFTHIPSLIRTLGILLVVLLTPQIFAQTQDQPQKETDPLVLKKLEWFQDVKFGLLMHWGPYSQWGVVESWSICSEDEPWCQRNINDYVEYCRKYEQLKETFNPVKFDPGKWAAAARYAGMKYVVFTTKHHDGFCMFDTKETDYRITDPGCPFHSIIERTSQGNCSMLFGGRALVSGHIFPNRTGTAAGTGIHIGHTLIAT